jgi:hypothetical protein
MGWQCISQDCSVRIYSISEDLGKLVTRMIEFLFNIAPGIYAILILTMVAVFTLYLFYYLKRALSMSDA